MARVQIEIPKESVCKSTSRGGNIDDVSEATELACSGRTFGSRPKALRFRVDVGTRHHTRPAAFYPSAYAMLEEMGYFGLESWEEVPITYIQDFSGNVPRGVVRMTVDVVY
jgi:hypothetical protein